MKADKYLIGFVFLVCLAFVVIVGKVFGVWYGLGTLFLMVLVVNVLYWYLTGRWMDFWR